jgi:hypothetical protein
MRAFLMFGQFLRKEKLVSDDDVIRARLYQKDQNRLIGDRLVEKGWITEEQVQRILVIQEGG